MLKVARLRTHIKAHVADLVGLVVSVHGHDDGALELVKDSLLVLLWLGRLVRVSEALLSKSLHLLIDQLQAVVNRQILTDIVNDQVKTALENPRRCEETRPSLNGVVEYFCFRSHKEARVAPNLAEI